MLRNRTFDELRVGDTASIVRIVARDDIDLFAKVSGDVNPSHLDTTFAATGLSGHVVAHGMNIPVFPETKVALKGKKALVVGIANEHSIAWGCARAFRALGAELAVTYLDERARPYVEPLAKELQAPIFMPLNVDLERQTEKVFERIEKEWGKLDILLHSIALSPKEALHGRVIDVGRDGFLKTMVRGSVASRRTVRSASH